MLLSLTMKSILIRRSTVVGIPYLFWGLAGFGDALASLDRLTHESTSHGPPTAFWPRKSHERSSRTSVYDRIRQDWNRWLGIPATVHPCPTNGKRTEFLWVTTTRNLTWMSYHVRLGKARFELIRTTNICRVRGKLSLTSPCKVGPTTKRIRKPYSTPTTVCAIELKKKAYQRSKWGQRNATHPPNTPKAAVPTVKAYPSLVMDTTSRKPTMFHGMNARPCTQTVPPTCLVPKLAKWQLAF